MIISISGTPATGKTSLAGELSRITGLKAHSLNSIAEKLSLYSGYDKKRDCRIVDTKKMREEIKKLAGKESFIIESHYAHEMPADIIILLRASPAEIEKRGKAKGWSEAKCEENKQAEIMEVCRNEALETGITVRELETTGKTAKKSATEAAKILQEEGLFISSDLEIPQSLRSVLRKPYGKLFGSIEEASGYMKGSEIVSVGDKVSYSLYSEKENVKVFVTDGMVRREPFTDSSKIKVSKIHAMNSHGKITRDLWKAVTASLEMKKPVKIEVEGEEDMAVIAFMILYPEGTSIAYGLFDRGVCVIKNGKESRKTARNLLKKISGANG